MQIAAIFEFAGALLLGRVSTNTIAGGIASISAFQREPEVYSYGMCCALGVGTVWLVITSYMGLNVSSTHSISELSLPACKTVNSSSGRAAYTMTWPSTTSAEGSRGQIAVVTN